VKVASSIPPIARSGTNICSTKQILALNEAPCQYPNLGLQTAAFSGLAPRVTALSLSGLRRLGLCLIELFHQSRLAAGGVIGMDNPLFRGSV
jgi:hypothetical protein